jgi:hypothetical protein
MGRFWLPGPLTIGQFVIYSRPIGTSVIRSFTECWESDAGRPLKGSQMNMNGGMSEGVDGAIPEDDEPPSRFASASKRSLADFRLDNHSSARKPNGKNSSDKTAGTAAPLALSDSDRASRCRIIEPGLRTRSARPPDNPRTLAFREQHFPDATDEQWDNWRWQSQHRIRKLDQLERMLVLSDDERDALTRGGQMLPVGITPYYLGLLDAEDAQQPLRRTVVPSTGEFIRTPGEADDPLGEDGHSPVPGLVHRYPDRVLLLPLDFCSTYCRYCTRSRVVGHG